MTDKEIIGSLYKENLELKSKLSTREIDDVFKSKLSDTNKAKENFSDKWVIAKALKILGCNWIARDKNGKLYIYQNKPTRQKESTKAEWDDPKDTYFFLRNLFEIKGIQNYFSNIKWEDKEPTNLDDLLKEYNYE